MVVTWVVKDPFKAHLHMDPQVKTNTSTGLVCHGAHVLTLSVIFYLVTIKKLPYILMHIFAST